MGIIGFRSDTIYQDRFDVWRNNSHIEGGITKNERVKVVDGAWGRIYSNPTSSISMEDAAAGIDKSNQLMCPYETDIKTGDEIIVYRSARIRNPPVEVVKYIAGNPNRYASPFGGAILKELEHLQVALFNAERVDS